MPMKRRQFLKAAGMTGVGFALLPTGFRAINLKGLPAGVGLSDPVLQPKFVNPVPDAMAPGFIYQPDAMGAYNVMAAKAKQATGLINPLTGKPAKTNVWGYADAKDGMSTWPGRTFQVKNLASGGTPDTVVDWENGLKKVNSHLVPVDTSLHWCYSLPGYEGYSIKDNGVPIITHLHGGHSDFQFDGNPEFFYTPGGKKTRITGPQWALVPGGFTTRFRYDNNVKAGNLWYHDHALGITRLNVYAGLAGFYFVRDNDDTGAVGNPLDLPAWPYEKAYAIQDRMFMSTGELFYPAFPGDPYYDDFITGEGAKLPPEIFPGGGPTALAEFFGDHMVVNGLIWPKENVEPRNYRMHLLNGTDSRFMAIRFREAASPTATDLVGASAPITFKVIGSDQGLASSVTETDMLVFEPGSRYDIVFDFKGLSGKRIIMENIGGDEPFGGDIPGTFLYSDTDKVMAFDVIMPLDTNVPDVNPSGIVFGPTVNNTVDRTRKVALFEGMDEYGRLQPLLGTAEKATDYTGADIEWPPEYAVHGLTGPMEGAIPWHSPTTENPALGSTEIWEIYNATGDAHPVHLHLVHFEVLDRQEYSAEIVEQPVVQHNGLVGVGFRLENISLGAMVDTPAGYVENTPKDMVTALPGQVTRIKATFDKPGRYVWHCHILSHEDHEMMRVLHVGKGAHDHLHTIPMAKKGLSANSESGFAEGNKPVTFELRQNYPNPFNPSTTINFSLPSDEYVVLDIYNSAGRRVRRLVNDTYRAGTHSVKWDGRNSWGVNVASGMYVYRIKAGKQTMTKKMNLIR